MTDAETEATPEPEGPPPARQYEETIWQDDDDTSISSLLPPMPLEYSAGTPLAGEFAMMSPSPSDDASLFSTQSMQDRLHRTLQQRVEHTRPAFVLEPTLDVARLVQQVEMLKHTNAELRHANKLLLAGGQALEAQHEGLQEARTTAELRVREAHHESGALRRQLEQAQEELANTKEEISKLQARLERQVSENANEEKQKISEARNESRDEISRLQRENALLVQEKTEMANVLAETQTLLEQATVECAATQRHKTTASVGVQTDSSTSFADRESTMDVDYFKALVSMTSGVTRNSTTGSPRCSSAAESDSPNFLPISECLGRIRNATEYASLVQEHEKEISRLICNHEAEKKQLCAKLEKEKDALLEDAMSEMNAGYKGLRRRLESDHNDKMEKMEKQHAKELQRLRQEADVAATAAAESLQVAMAQVASANQRCQRESKRRQALEIRLDELQAEFDEQKRALANKHATDLSKLGHGWEAERKSLVDALQRECNSVFDRTKSASPRSVTTDFFAEVELAEKQHSNPSPLSEKGDGQVQSSTFSELDRTLRETEALVEKVLGGRVL